MMMQGRQPVAGGGGFDPLTLTNLAAWYDASDAASFTYSSGSLVSQWNDKSGNGRHVSQATGSKQPTRTGTQNGMSTVVFDATDQLFRTMGSPIFADHFSAFSVWKQVGTLPTYLKSPATTDNGSNLARPIDRWHQNSSNNYFFVGGTGIAATFDLRSQSSHFVHTVLAARAAGTIVERRNGVDVTSITNVSVTTQWTTAGQRLSVGGRSDAAVGFVGELAEIIYINGAPTTTERNDVESYLSTKWGT